LAEAIKQENVIWPRKRSLSARNPSY
jgi:hypothetical protein